jgi:hypothetical protein
MTNSRPRRMPARGSGLVAVLDLDLVERDRQVLVGGVHVLDGEGEHLLVSRAEEVVVRPCGPSAGRHWGRTRSSARSPRRARGAAARGRATPGPDRVHLLAHDLLDPLAQHPQPQRQPGVDARRDAADVPGADQELVAQEQGGHAHGQGLSAGGQPGPGPRRRTRSGGTRVRRNRLDILEPKARTRAQIAQATGLTRATVSDLVESLVRGHMVTELAPRAAVGAGRPGVPLAPASGTIVGIGAEVAVDRLGVTAIDLSGRAVNQRVVERDLRGSDPQRTLPSPACARRAA